MNINKFAGLASLKKPGAGARSAGDAITSNQANNADKFASLKLSFKKPDIAISEQLPELHINQNAPIAPVIIDADITVHDAHGNSKLITLNDKQLEFSRLLANKLSCVLIGAAGTGKTTCTQAGIQALINSGNVLTIKDNTHKTLKHGASGIVVCSYTRRATQNIRRQMSVDIAANTLTCHKLIEFSPVFEEYIDNETGLMRKKRTFQPKRNALNKLCAGIQTIVIDEASMLSLDLFNQILDAIPDVKNTQFVFIGDLNQLPPVFGHAILGYKLLELPVIELTEVYRQALESPIIRLAHRILSGKVIMDMEFSKLSEKGKLQIIPYHKRMDSESALFEVLKMFYAGYDSESYNPDNDIILCPQTNDKSAKKMNCTLLNKYIANHIARKNERETFEIIASFRKLYYSIGDKCLFDKQDCKIIDIAANPEYLGQEYQAPSIHLDYFGHNEVNREDMTKNTDFDLDYLIAKAANAEDDGAKLQCSHITTIQLDDDEDAKIELKTLGDYMALDLAYAITVHKSQGSEWRKVFLVLHSSHNPMLKRELLYTAITRAKESLVIICEKDSFIKGIKSQAIKGTTLAEKAEFFKGKEGMSKKVIDVNNIFNLSY